MSCAVPTYLISRNGIFYFNCRIPSSVRNRYNLKKLFFRKSLRTRKIREAVKLSRKYLVMMDDKITHLEEYLFDSHDRLIKGRKILEEYEDTFKNGSSSDLDEFWNTRSKDDYDSYRMAVDEKEKTNNNVETKHHETSVHLDDLIKYFIDFKKKKGEWKDRSVVTNTGILYVIRDFLEYAIGKKNPMIHEFKTVHAIKFEDEFCLYPSNCKNKFPDMSMAQIMEMIKDPKKSKDVSIIATNTYNNYASLLQSLFSWAKSDKKGQYLQGDNVFVELKKAKEKPKSYEPFNDGDLKAIFNTELFSKKDFKIQFAWKYWVPIIMLYHGMRLEEVAQLRTHNICKVDVWCFDIKDEFDKEGKIVTTTKAKGKNTGQRYVPIHPKVIDIGFLKYVQYQKDKGKRKVFNTLSGRDGKGAYKQSGVGVSKWFNEDSDRKKSYLTKVGIDKKKRHVVLYSFRHTVETLLINHQDKIENDKTDTVFGHSIKSMGRKHYGSYTQKTLLEDVIKKIDYPNADLPWDSTNTEYNKVPFPWE